MQARCLAVLVLTLIPVTALPAAGGVCVRNATDEPAFFVAEAGPGTRRSGMLAVGENLCSGLDGDDGGVVRVFAVREAIEGCSRLVPGGATETLIRYADFDRCHWSSHDE